MTALSVPSRMVGPLQSDVWHVTGSLALLIARLQKAMRQTV